MTLQPDESGQGGAPTAVATDHQSSLSHVLIQYYTAVTTALLGDSEETLKVCLSNAISMCLLQSMPQGMAVCNRSPNGEMKNCCALPFIVAHSVLQIYSQIVYEDIASNSKISPLLPSFISFVRNGMQKHGENRALVPRVLLFLKALFDNPYLNLSPKPYVRELSL